jgi:hypothetical protein
MYLFKNNIVDKKKKKHVFIKLNNMNKKRNMKKKHVFIRKESFN